MSALAIGEKVNRPEPSTAMSLANLARLLQEKSVLCR